MNPKLKKIWYNCYEPLRLNWERFWFNAKVDVEWNGIPLQNTITDKTITFHIPISVYCPTFNRADILLERALPSVCNQTYSNLEFIIVDDCSTDNTREKVMAWCLKHHEFRVKVIRTKSRKNRYPPTRMNHWFAGPVVPANLGLDECRGHWIARIDDDDVWTPDHIEKLLGFAIKKNAEFVSSGYMVNEEYHGIEGDEWHGGASSYFYRSYLKFFKYNIDCWRKKTNRVNDLDLCERMRDAGVRMSFLDEPTFTITPRPGETEIGSNAYKNGGGIEEKYKF